MTKKDYELIAGAFQKAYAEARREGINELIGIDIALEQITDALQKENNKFDQVKFLRYATSIIK